MLSSKTAIQVVDALLADTGITANAVLRKLCESEPTKVLSAVTQIVFDCEFVETKTVVKSNSNDSTFASVPGVVGNIASWEQTVIDAMKGARTGTSKVAGIKATRLATGCGLKEGKEWIEKNFDFMDGKVLRVHHPNLTKE